MDIKTGVVRAAMLLAFALVASSTAYCDVAKVLKTVSGNCGGGDNFKKKYYVDVDNDNKADHLVIVWCNNKVTVTKPVVVSGDWRTNWNSWYETSNYALLSSLGKPHFSATFYDNITNVSLGSIVQDSTADTAVVTWWSATMISTDISSDQLAEKMREEQPRIEIRNEDDDNDAIEFDAFGKGQHEIRITWTRPNGTQVRSTRFVIADGLAKISLLVPRLEGVLITHVTIVRPEHRVDSGDFNRE